MLEGKRRGLVIEEELWKAIRRASALETARTGERTISASEWIRTWVQAVIDAGLTFEDLPLAKAQRKGKK